MAKRTESHSSTISAEDLEALLRQHLRWLRGWLGARLRGSQRQDVDDLCQEVLLRAIRGVSGLRDPDRFPSWLYAIANNVLRDFVRDTSRKRREARDFEAEPIDPRDERPSADRHEDLELALEAVLDLPERYREPMLLRHVDDLSYEEISAILRVSPNAVQVRISRARDRLRKSAVYRRLYESPSTSSSNEGRESAEIIELEARRRSFDTDETESQKTKRPLEK